MGRTNPRGSSNLEMAGKEKCHLPGRTRDQDEDGALVDVNYSHFRKEVVCMCVCVCMCNCVREKGTEFWGDELNEESSVMLLGILV